MSGMKRSRISYWFGGVNMKRVGYHYLPRLSASSRRALVGFEQEGFVAFGRARGHKGKGETGASFVRLGVRSASIFFLHVLSIGDQPSWSPILKTLYRNEYRRPTRLVAYTCSRRPSKNVRVLGDQLGWSPKNWNNDKYRRPTWLVAYTCSRRPLKMSES